MGRLTTNRVHFRRSENEPGGYDVLTSWGECVGQVWRDEAYNDCLGTAASYWIASDCEGRFGTRRAATEALIKEDNKRWRDDGESDDEWRARRQTSN